MIAGPSGYYAYDHAGKRVKKMGGAEEFYFYGIGGQKLATTVCTGEDDGTGCQPTTYNVYFGGKLVKSKGAVVATDRLGSVRASSTGDRMTYYPYGEERSSTADGREKFGTYMRDSVTTDYADQRYYAVGMGRFFTADPSTGEDAGKPYTWNRYAYVHGDPINFYDRHGLNEAPGGYCPRSMRPVMRAVEVEAAGMATVEAVEIVEQITGWGSCRTRSATCRCRLPRLRLSHHPVP